MMNDLEQRILEVEKRLLRLEEENVILMENLVEYAKLASQLKENEKLIDDNNSSKQDLSNDCINCTHITNTEDCV